VSRILDRRKFLKACTGVAGASVLARYRAIAAPEMRRTKIRDIKVMVLQGERTYTLIKVETDAGVYGIGEGYGSPGVGIKEGVLELRPYFIGKDPLDIETLYTGPTYRTDGSAHMLLRAMSGIEAALWDVSGKLLNLPVATLLGGQNEGRTGRLDRVQVRLPALAACNGQGARPVESPAHLEGTAGHPARLRELPRAAPGTR